MRKRTFRKNILFAFLSLLLVFLFIESLVRLLGFEPRVDNPFFMLVRVFEYPDYFEKDEALFWRLRSNIDHNKEFLVPGSYRTNSLGLRGPQIDPAILSGNEKVVCLGNSCTFGWRLAENETYPAALEQKLRQSSLKQFVVINCGVPGYSSFQGLRMLERYQPRLDPDYVTICFGWNDQWAAGFDIEDKDQRMAGQFLLDIQNVFSRSYLYRAVKYLLLSKYEKRQEYTFNRQSPHYRVSLQDYRDNLIAITRFCRSRKITPILITAPIADTDPKQDLPYEIYHHFYNQIACEVAAEFRVALVDAAAAFINHPEFFTDPATDYIHYNKYGADWIASQLAEVITSAQPKAISGKP